MWNRINLKFTCKIVRIESRESNGDHQRHERFDRSFETAAILLLVKVDFNLSENLSPIFLSMRCIFDFTSLCSSSLQLTDIVSIMNYVQVLSLYSFLFLFRTYTTHQTVKSSTTALFQDLRRGALSRSSLASYWAVKAHLGPEMQLST